MSNPAPEPETSSLTKWEKKKEKLFESSKKIIRYINRVHKMKWNLIHRFSGGYSSGAYLLESASGEKAVLKWNNIKSTLEKVEQAAAAVKLARDFGWPTPAWLVYGISPSGYPYQVQEFVNGKSRDFIDMILVEDALRVIHLQAGKAPITDHNWSIYDRRVAYGEDGDAMQRIAEYSESGRELISLLTDKLEPFRSNSMPEHDLVHGDFHGGNVLMVGDQITGLIDVESLGKGSRHHDIATLMVFILFFDGDSAALEPLRAYAHKHAAPGEFEEASIGSGRAENIQGKAIRNIINVNRSYPSSEIDDIGQLPDSSVTLIGEKYFAINDDL